MGRFLSPRIPFRVAGLSGMILRDLPRAGLVCRPAQVMIGIRSCAGLASARWARLRPCIRSESMASPAWSSPPGCRSARRGVSAGGDEEETALNTFEASDAVCRRFEADWRDGKQPRVDAYLPDVPAEARPALRTKLEALLREARAGRRRSTDRDNRGTVWRGRGNPSGRVCHCRLRGRPTAH